MATKKEKNVQSLKKLSESGMGRTSIYDMKDVLVDLYRVCFYDALGIKSKLALHKFEHRNKE